MTSALTQTQTEALDRNGYVVLPDLLDAARLERLRYAFSDASAQEGGTQHVVLHAETPERNAWESLRAHPTVLAAAQHVLGGADFQVRDLHGRNPLPGYGNQGLHADWVPRKAGASFFVVTVIWMLDPFNAENGATRVVPGSHLVTTPISRQMAQPASRHPREQTVTGAAGGALILNGHLWHSGRTNESRGPRRAAQMIIQRTT